MQTDSVIRGLQCSNASPTASVPLLSDSLVSYDSELFEKGGRPGIVATETAI